MPRVAVASGKGGTGKTTVATGLARILADGGNQVSYLDCDVEAPNGQLFLTPTGLDRTEVRVPVAQIDVSRCTGDGACARACRFGAILSLPAGSVVFPDLCHGCGACLPACRHQAVSETVQAVGAIEMGRSAGLTVCQGVMDVGRQAEHDLVRAVRAAAPDTKWAVLDAPPGVGCSVVETLRGVDVVLLVTEPTPAGLHDLELAVELVTDLGLPGGVLLNRAGTHDPGIRDLCARAQLPLLAEIPHSVSIAQAYSRAELVVEAVPQLRPLFERLGTQLADLARTVPTRTVPTSTAPTSQDRDEPRYDHAASGNGHRDIAEPADRRTGQGYAGCGTPHEIVVLSGKGGTGKTSITAGLIALAGETAVVDADVDAANLHLLLDAQPHRREPFIGGQVAAVDADRCTGCELCADRCRFDALDLYDPTGGAVLDAVITRVDPAACEGCGACLDACPDEALELVPRRSGEWFSASTPFGPLVHARLHPGQQNSGKLAALVRDRGTASARAEQHPLLITDGPPGIGCPAVAALTGAAHTLLVTEPTLSGLSDLHRVTTLARQLGVPAAVCINKVDLNPELAEQVTEEIAGLGLPVLGRVRYDKAVASAHQAGANVISHAPNSPSAEDIRQLWNQLQEWAGTRTCPARPEALP